MPGLVPGIHALFLHRIEEADGRDKPGHEDRTKSLATTKLGDAS